MNDIFIDQMPPLMDIDAKLYCWSSKHWNVHNKLLENQDDYIIQQFTGLKDIKGVQIFDGDILLEDYNGELLYWTVIYSKNDGCWLIKCDGETESLCKYNIKLRKYTVTGNIFTMAKDLISK